MDMDGRLYRSLPYSINVMYNSAYGCGISSVSMIDITDNDATG